IEIPKMQMYGQFVSTETSSSSRSEAFLEFQTELSQKSFIWIGLCVSFFNPFLGPIILILRHLYRKTNDERKKFIYSSCIAILLGASIIVSLLVCVVVITYLSIPCEAKPPRNYVTTNNPITAWINENETDESKRKKYFENLFLALDKMYGARDKNGTMPIINDKTLQQKYII
ncbi:hypothetical protein CHS0354_009009, partial [Potamilus streckersoni]